MARLVGAVYLATPLLAWRLARRLHPLCGPGAVLLTGMWALGAAPYLFLHTELWGVRFLLAGALALRNERGAAAAVALRVSALLRERLDSSLASLSRWASPPDRVGAGWPRRT